MTISVIVITYKRLTELKETIQLLLEEQADYDELILIDNHSEDGTKEYGIELEAKEEKVKFYSLPQNLGVAGGRNFGIKNAHGETLVFLDDDAVFAQKGALKAVKSILASNRNVGAIAFQIVNFYTRQMRTEEIPFTNKSLDMSTERLTSIFIGAGHAIRREVFDECGLYPEDYFYGVEELDLSYRIVGHGYQILYSPAVVVLHKQINIGRVTNKEKWIMSYRNRMLSAYKFLPMKYVLWLGFILFIKIGILSRSIAAPAEGLHRFWSVKRENNRQVVDTKAIRYLKENYGRLWI